MMMANIRDWLFKILTRRFSIPLVHFVSIQNIKPQNILLYDT